MKHGFDTKIRLIKRLKSRYFVVCLFRKSVYLFESIVFDVEKKEKIVRSNFKRLFYFKG